MTTLETNISVITDEIAGLVIVDEAPVPAAKQAPTICTNCGGPTKSITSICSRGYCAQLQKKAITKLRSEGKPKKAPSLLGRCDFRHRNGVQCIYDIMNDHETRCKTHLGSPVNLKCRNCEIFTARTCQICIKCIKSGVIN